MALTLTYDDAYLAPLIAAKPTWETRALADVAQLGTFPDPWPAKLAVLRACVLCCLESLADENDVFSAKLKQYQKEWAASLQAARLAADAAASAPTRLVSLPIQRG
jgi:tRNA(Ile)-lysidine synthase TilS/MesJ